MFELEIMLLGYGVAVASASVVLTKICNLNKFKAVNKKLEHVEISLKTLEEELKKINNTPNIKN